MALLEGLAKNPTPTGLAVGLGAALTAPFLLPAVSRTVRPVAKAALRSGITLYRGAAEPVSAIISDLVTEAQLELASSRAGQPGAANEAKPPCGKGQKSHASKRG